MIDKVVRNLLLTFLFCKMTKIINFFDNYTCQKEKDVLQCKQVKRKEERSYDVGTRIYTIYYFLLF